MGFFDDFSAGFTDSFNQSYNTSRKNALQQEADAAKAAAANFLKRQEAAAELRRTDRDRISRAQRLEQELNLPQGSWANIYYWDMDGLSQDKIREMATEGTFNAIPAPASDTETPATPSSTEVPASVSTSGVDAQTTAMLNPQADTSSVNLTYTSYAEGNGRTGDPTAGQNQEIVDLVTQTWASLGFGENVGINSGFRGEDEANHDGNAFDIDVSGLDRNQRVALVEQLSANGAKGIGFGNNTIHVDARGDRPRVWWYDAEGNDTTTIPEALAYSAGAMGAHVGGNLNAGGRPTDGISRTDDLEGTVSSDNGTFGAIQINAGDSPFLARVNTVLEEEHTSRVLSILGISAEEYERGKGQLTYNNVNPSITFTYAPKVTGDDLPTNWNQAMIAQVMESEAYLNAETPEERMAILEEARRSMESNGSAAKSPKDAAFELLVSGDEYRGADAAGRTALLQQFERTWSDLGRAEGEDNRTAKQIAFDLYQESDEYTSATATERVDLLANWERQWAEDTARREGSNSTTLTPARLAELRSQAEIDLLSADPDVRARAEEYLNTIYPIQERNLMAVNAAVGNGDRPTFSVRYTTADGTTRTVTAHETPEGYVPVGSDQVIENVVEAVAPEDMEVRLEAVRAASAVYKPALDLRGAVTVASYGAFELDRIAARSEYVLTSTAGGVSLFEGAKTEIRTLMDVIGAEGSNMQSDQQSVLAAVNARVDEMVASGDTQLTAEMASEYKQFTAAVVRYVFAAGKALGQEGNGFSNSDYENIFNSIVNSTSYEAFSNNLRRFTREQFANLDETVAGASDSPLIAAAREVGAGYLVDSALQNSEQYFTQPQGGVSPTIVDRRRSIHSWAQNDAGKIVRYIESVDEDTARAIPSLQDFVGRGVILFDNGRIEAY